MRKTTIQLTTIALLLVGFALINPVSFAMAEDMVLATGQFSGRSGHKVSGTLEIVKTSNGYQLRLGDSFKIDGAPGPYLGFGQSGKYASETEFSKLLKKRGKQIYKIPAKIDISKFDTFFIWCKPYKVPLAVAKLKQGQS